MNRIGKAYLHECLRKRSSCCRALAPLLLPLLPLLRLLHLLALQVRRRPSPNAASSTSAGPTTQPRPGCSSCRPPGLLLLMHHHR